MRRVAWQSILRGVAWVLYLAGPLAAAQGQAVEGFTEPYRTVELAAPEPGTITSLVVREGDAVKQGQLVAALDVEILQASLEIARARAESTARLDSALAEAAMRRARLEKLAALAASGNARIQEVERARADVEIAEAAVCLAREERLLASLECKRVEAQIERRMLRSPFDGVVAAIHRRESEQVTALEPAVMTLVQLDPLCVHFSIPGGQAAALAAGQQVKLLFAGAPRKAQGRIEWVSPVTDKASGTVKVKVVLANPQGAFRSGVRCRLQLGRHSSAGDTSDDLPTNGEPHAPGLGPLTYRDGS